MGRGVVHQSEIVRLGRTEWEGCRERLGWGLGHCGLSTLHESSSERIVCRNMLPGSQSVPPEPQPTHFPQSSHRTLSPTLKSHPQVLPLLAEAPFPLDLFLSLCDDPALELDPPAPPSSPSLGFETSVFAGETSSGLDSSYDANTHQPLIFSKYP